MKDIKNNYFETHYHYYIMNIDKYLESQFELFESHLYTDLKAHPKFPMIKALDLCCGVGDFGYFLHRLGCKEVIGVDSSEGAIENCNRILPSYTFFCEDVLRFLGEDKETYDIISVFSCLEHFRKAEIRIVLEYAKEKLNRDGMFLMSTPNMEALFGNTAGRYNDFTHEVGFTKSSLEQVLREAGFEDIIIFGSKHKTGGLKKWLVYKVYQPIIFKMIFLFMRSLHLKFPDISGYVLWGIVR